MLSLCVMRFDRHIWMAVLLAFLVFVSCVKTGGEGALESPLVIDADIAASASSKAIITGTAFQEGHTIGLFVYHSETADVNNPDEMSKFSLYGARYRNIRAAYNTKDAANPWRFRLEGATTLFENIYLLNPTVATFEKGLAVVAYAPWIEGIPSIKEIPFTLGGKSEEMTDLMWARQNTHDKSVASDAGVNYKIVPDGNAKNVKLTFRHALARLDIGFRCQNEGSVITLSSIKLKKKDGSQTPLLVSGTFNAMDGTISNPAKLSSLQYDYTDKSYTFQSTTDYTYVPMLICPQEYKADGDYILEFQFNWQTVGEDVQTPKYEIKLSDVNGGFKAGEVYTFRFTVDESIHLDNVLVSEEWI